MAVLGSRQHLWLGARCRNRSAACRRGAGGQCRALPAPRPPPVPALGLSISGAVRRRGRWRGCRQTPAVAQPSLSSSDLPGWICRAIKARFPHARCFLAVGLCCPRRLVLPGLPMGPVWGLWLPQRWTGADVTEFPLSRVLWVWVGASPCLPAVPRGAVTSHFLSHALLRAPACAHRAQTPPFAWAAGGQQSAGLGTHGSWPPAMLLPLRRPPGTRCRYPGRKRFGEWWQR